MRSAGRLALLAFAQLIIALDFNIVYVALPDIGAEVGFTDGSLQWVVSAYVVPFGGFLLLGGRAVDRFGAGRIFVAGLALYGLASLAGGLVAEPWALLSARAVQGLGGALLTPATLALIGLGFPEGAARNRAFAVWGMAGSAGLAAGSVAGGLLTEFLGWQWVFFVNVPLVVAAIVVAPKLLPKSEPARGGGFDVPGALVITAGAALVVLGLAGGPESGWISPEGLGAIGAGVVLIALFVLIEARSANPLVPLRTFAHRSLSVSMGVIAVFQASLMGMTYLLTIYLQPVMGLDALQAGLAFLPQTLVTVIGAGRLAPALMARFGIRGTLIWLLVLTGAGLALVTAGMSAGGPYWALLPGFALWGLAGGACFVVMFASAATGVAPQQQGVASGLATTSQQIGGAAGLAVIVAIAGQTGVAGLRTAGWVAAAATAAAALIALLLVRRTIPPNREEARDETVLTA
ncbi:MFS transporter [Phytomonospora sp. NPDC050363]|uniref:MFS transporter n=1 Tax=Phytomonospora sp. NPDC050363 TaxID=3155642 RepID=UPI0033DC7447